MQIVSLASPASGARSRASLTALRKLKFFFTQQSVIAQRVIPLWRDLRDWIDAAIAERRGSCALISFFERVISLEWPNARFTISFFSF